MIRKVLIIIEPGPRRRIAPRRTRSRRHLPYSTLLETRQDKIQERDSEYSKVDNDSFFVSRGEVMTISLIEDGLTSEDFISLVWVN